jgi:anti-anti-sigma regulatory factor
MSIETVPFKISDHDKDCLRIIITGKFGGTEAASLREAINKYLDSDFDTIYIDAKDVTETDLSGMNEVIHAHHVLDITAKKLIFVYQRDSAVEKWVETTGLDKFVSTAIIPA